MSRNYERHREYLNAYIKIHTDAQPPRRKAMNRNNYTPAERALCLIGVMAGKSLEEINTQMEKSLVGMRYELNPRSYELLKTAYVPTFDKSAAILKRDLAEAMWEHCVSPKPMSKLKDGG